jgi:hypothetical protein
MSIGAVSFETGHTKTEEFFTNVSLEDCFRHGLTVDASTIYWWLKQPDAARLAMCVDPVPLPEALIELNDFVKAQEPESLWTHATFDIPILSNAYRRVGLVPTWHYAVAKDIRTLEELKSPVQLERKGIHHSAIDDARFQADYIRQLLNTPDKE